MDTQMFLDRENWLGSFYELAIEYAPPHEDEQLLKAIHALWSCQQLEGPVEGPYGEQHVLPLSLEPEDNHRLYGKLKLAEGKIVGCLSVTVREKDGSDWLDLCIPTGMLRLVYRVEHPLLSSTNPWFSEIDHVFVTIAEKIYASSPFNLAILGEEASGYRYAQTMTVDDLVRGGYLVPPALVQHLRPYVSCESLPSGLCWFPDQQEALDTYEQAIHLDPNATDAYFNKGITLSVLKRYQEALDAYEQAIHLDPNATIAYIGKGNALSNLKRYQEALDAYEQAIHLDPNAADAHFNKGVLLGQLGRRREAKQAYEKARQLGYNY